MKELSYVPVGRPAVPRVSTMVVAFDFFGEEYGTIVLGGVMTEAARRGIRTVVDFTPPSDGCADWVLRHASSGVGTVILVATGVTHELVVSAAQHGVALVAIDPKSESDASVTSIGPTNWQGTALATTHLTELGHRRIGFVGLDMSVDFAVERFSGFRSSLDRSGLPVIEDYVLASKASSTEKFEDGRAMGLQLAQLPVPPTAVVAVCDAVALGVIAGARSAGLATPDDLSVVGFDDVPMARRASPQLTTVHQPLADMGVLAVRTGLEIQRSGRPTTPHVQLATRLVVRNSTRPLVAP